MPLDRYIADEHGNVDGAQPDEEVHAFINNLQRLVGKPRGGWIDPTTASRSRKPRTHPHDWPTASSLSPLRRLKLAKVRHHLEQLDWRRCMGVEPTLEQEAAR